MKNNLRFVVTDFTDKPQTSLPFKSVAVHCAALSNISVAHLNCAINMFLKMFTILFDLNEPEHNIMDICIFCIHF